jgi:cytochrome c-type biogenesis protein CcmH
MTEVRMTHRRRLRMPAARPLGSILLAFLLTCAFVAALPAAPPLTAEQESTARRIEEQLMAPCCFGSTVATHHSPAADEIREHVRSRVAEGATEQQVLDEYLDRFGERILAQPVARGFNLLAYWMPVVGLLCGTGIVTLWLLRRRRAVGPERSPLQAEAEPGGTSPRLRHQFERELAEFDE